MVMSALVSLTIPGTDDWGWRSGRFRNGREIRQLLFRQRRQLAAALDVFSPTTLLLALQPPEGGAQQGGNKQDKYKRHGKFRQRESVTIVARGKVFASFSFGAGSQIVWRKRRGLAMLWVCTGSAGLRETMVGSGVAGNPRPVPTPGSIRRLLHTLLKSPLTDAIVTPSLLCLPAPYLTVQAAFPLS